MTKFYTAVGIMKQRKGEKGMTYPYVEIGKNEYHLDMQEMVLWSVLNWRILSTDEIKKLYEKKVNELGLGYHKTMEACQYHLMQRGLIAEGVGVIPADALYDLLSNLYVIPVSENIFLRLFSFVRLTFKGLPLKVTKRILFRDKRSDGEKKVMRIAHQATFSTAEIIRCVEVIYNNGRFSAGTLSFELPNGIGIDTGNDEICGQGFYLTAPDESFIVQIDIKQSDNNAYEEFSHIFDDETSYELIGKTEKYSVGGLDGYKAIYADEDTLNEEYTFDLNECGDYTVLDVFVMIRKGCATYDENYKNRIVSELLNSIKVRNC